MQNTIYPQINIFCHISFVPKINDKFLGVGKEYLMKHHVCCMCFFFLNTVFFLRFLIYNAQLFYSRKK